MLRSKRIDLEHTAQFMYRKNNYAPLHKLYLETTEKVVRRRAKLGSAKARCEERRLAFEAKRTEFAVHKAEQRMRLEESRRQMEELRTMLRPDLRSMKNQLDRYNSQIVNDKKRMGALQEKLSYNLTHANTIRKTLEESVEQPVTMHKKKTVPEDKGTHLSSVEKYNVNAKEERKKQADDYIDLMGIGKRLASHIIYSADKQHESKYKIDPDKCSVKEAQLFESIKPLLEGMTIYKKYKNKSSLKEKVFDPLCASRDPPESCGFGRRSLVYNPATCCLEFRALKKPFAVDHAVSLLDLKRALIPSETLHIIRAQAKLNLLTTDGDRSVELQSEVEEAKLERLARIKENSQFLEQCAGVKLYPFEIIAQNSRLEVIAESYSTLKKMQSMIEKLAEDKQLAKGMSKQIQKAN